MSGETGYHRRGVVIGTKISNLLCSLGPETYDEISPKIEYWIEYALTKQSVNSKDLVDQVSSVAWHVRSSDMDVARFLKELSDTPHRSDATRSFVDSLCSHLLLLFAAASAEDLSHWHDSRTCKIVAQGGEGFVRAASLVGHLIEGGVFDYELVQRHLVKPLITHHYTEGNKVHKSFRAAAIYQLLTTAGNTLLQGFLDPGDVQVCFETMDSQISSEALEVGFTAFSSALHHDLIFSDRNFATSTQHG